MPSSKPLANRSLLIFLDDEYEDLEFWLINAGAIWEDARWSSTGTSLSSRRPDDLPDFCSGIFQALASLDRKSAKC